MPKKTNLILYSIFLIVIAAAMVSAEDNVVTLYNMTLSYNPQMTEDSIDYINIKAINLNGSTTDVESLSITFPDEVNVHIGEKERTGVGEYKIPITFLKNTNLTQTNFSVTLQQYQKTVTGIGTIDIFPKDNYHDTVQKILDFLKTWGILILFVIVMIVIIIKFSQL